MRNLQNKKMKKIKVKRKVKKFKPYKNPHGEPLQILSLDEAAKRLNDDEVYRKASKGFRWKDD